MRSLLKIIGLFGLLYVLPAGCMFAQHKVTHDRESWWDLRRDSSEQAPEAKNSDEAVIQVYAARAARWKGSLGVHTWVTTKRSTETAYTRLEVIGYAVSRGRDAVRIRTGTPDAYWFGNRPTLLRTIRGSAELDALIDRLHASAKSYPYNDTYHVWPGPNSNTFTAHLGRAVPELHLELPSTAIGKDYMPWNRSLSKTPSGTGGQLSLNGYASLLIGAEEGIELNLVGLTAGIDLWPLALKLPAVGRIGFSDYKQFNETDF